MKKEKLTGERKLVNGRVVIRRKKARPGASTSEDGSKKQKEATPQEYETGVKRQIDGFLYD